MNKAARISIVIPVYNAAEFLPDLVDSILQQSYTNWEVIAVDDQSSDQSWAYLQQIAQKDARFSVFQRDDSRKKGANSCRNLGLEQAKGEWVLFFDADDCLHLNKLEEHSKQLQLGGLDFSVGLHENFTDTKTTARPMDAKGNNQLELSASHFVQGKIFWITGDIVFRRSSIGTLRFNEALQSGQEYHFITGYLLQNPKGGYHPQAVLYRRLHADSIQGTIKRTSAAHAKARLIKHLAVFTSYSDQLDPAALQYLRVKIWEFYIKLAPDQLLYSLTELSEKTQVRFSYWQFLQLKLSLLIIAQSGKGVEKTIRLVRKWL